jgi:hypothetical protein
MFRRFDRSRPARVAQIRRDGAPSYSGAPASPEKKHDARDPPRVATPRADGAPHPALNDIAESSVDSSSPHARARIAPAPARAPHPRPRCERNGTAEAASVARASKSATTPAPAPAPAPGASSKAAWIPAPSPSPLPPKKKLLPSPVSVNTAEALAESAGGDDDDDAERDDAASAPAVRASDADAAAAAAAAASEAAAATIAAAAAIGAPPSAAAAAAVIAAASRIAQRPSPGAASASASDPSPMDPSAALGFSPFRPPTPGNSPGGYQPSPMIDDPIAAAAVAAAATNARGQHVYPHDIRAGAWKPSSPKDWSLAKPFRPGGGGGGGGTAGYNPGALGGGTFLQFAAGAMKAKSGLGYAASGAAAAAAAAATEPPPATHSCAARGGGADEMKPEDDAKDLAPVVGGAARDADEDTVAWRAAKTKTKTSGDTSSAPLDLDPAAMDPVVAAVAKILPPAATPRSPEQLAAAAVAYNLEYAQAMRAWLAPPARASPSTANPSATTAMSAAAMADFPPLGSEPPPPTTTEPAPTLTPTPTTVSFGGTTPASSASTRPPLETRPLEAPLPPLSMTFMHANGGGGEGEGEGAASPPLPARARRLRAGAANSDPAFRDALWHLADRESMINGTRLSNTLKPSAYDGASLDDLYAGDGDVRFFVIKSFAEEDVRKSVKHGCWTSTSQGNARLDAAWRGEDVFTFEPHGDDENGDDEREREREGEGEGETAAAAAAAAAADSSSSSGSGSGSDPASDAEPASDSDEPSVRSVDTQTPGPPLLDDATPATAESATKTTIAPRSRPGSSGAPPSRPRVILFFSVNSSGHFCGVAEMTSPVDDDAVDATLLPPAAAASWPGRFAVKWHIVKDVPNTALRHIRVCAGDKKPVPNSRDAQEIEPAQGALVLNIFREYRGGGVNGGGARVSSLLDDVGGDVVGGYGGFPWDARGAARAAAARRRAGGGGGGWRNGNGGGGGGRFFPGARGGFPGYAHAGGAGAHGFNAHHGFGADWHADWNAAIGAMGANGWYPHAHPHAHTHAHAPPHAHVVAAIGGHPHRGVGGAWWDPRYAMGYDPVAAAAAAAGASPYFAPPPQPQPHLVGAWTPPPATASAFAPPSGPGGSPEELEGGTEWKEPEAAREEETAAAAAAGFSPERRADEKERDAPDKENAGVPPLATTTATVPTVKTPPPRFRFGETRAEAPTSPSA